MKSTHNAARGLAGTPGIGCGNLYLEPGTQSSEEILDGIQQDFTLPADGLWGQRGYGDYSRGASGLWIENGELTTPWKKSPSPVTWLRCSCM